MHEFYKKERLRISMILKRLDWCGGLRHVFGTAGAFALSLPCVAADVDSVLVRQQWPWSTDVKVEYRLSNVTAPVNIKVECFNNGVALPSEDIDSAIIGRTYGLTKADEGIGFFYIDPVKAFGKTQVSLANFTVKLSLSDTDAIDTEPIYKIIDLQTKTVQHLSRADFYNDRGQKYGGWETNFAAIGSSPSSGTPYTTSLKNVFIWTGVTNNIEYKTTKLVMRRIPAGSFNMGGVNDWKKADSDNFSLPITISDSFYLGVFEVTRKQVLLLQGYDPSSLSEADAVKSASVFGKADSTASITYEQVRGLPSQWSGWPQDMYAVGENSALGRMRKVYPSFKFDLPTEAQWEYACRAGTETMYYSGVNPSKSQDNYEMELAELAWYKKNAGGATHEVGTLKPNAFGLYDILGNVGELVRDLLSPSMYTKTVDGTKTTVVANVLTSSASDPMGWMGEGEVVDNPDEKCYAMFRGENWDRDYYRVKSSFRNAVYALTGTWSTRFGARLMLPDDNTAK